MTVSFAPPQIFRHRADFLRLARAPKLARPGFVLQFRRTGTAAPLCTGFTATKKLGNAVTRNRARRRLKEATRLVVPSLPLTGVELVLICRKETATMPFPALCDGLRDALRHLSSEAPR
jgi:ribonuclease P protein component